MENNALFSALAQRAKANPQRIALPESDNDMILTAAARLVELGIGRPLLIGNEAAIFAHMTQLNLSTEGIACFDPTDEAAMDALKQAYLAKHQDFSEKAIARKCKDPVNTGMFLVKAGMADCVAAGRVYTTGAVIIAAQTILGLAPEMNVVSSVGIVNAPGFSGSEGSLLAIGDCAINPWPTDADLADIAIASADTVRRLLGWEPRVAMLAFSTMGSAEDPSIDAIRNAIALVRARRPEIKIDGEFQLDAAIDPALAARKVKQQSPVAGKANVLIFPNLHAGNIGVKLIQQFGHADVYGPVLQGFAYPVCDFSRSAPLSEMMGNLLMLIVRAQDAGAK